MRQGQAAPEVVRKVIENMIQRKPKRGRNQARDRQRIQSDTEAFLAAGGKIEVLPAPWEIK